MFGLWTLLQKRNDVVKHKEDKMNMWPDVDDIQKQ